MANIKLCVASSTVTPTSHSALADLTNDDHPQYLLTDGSRPLSANWDVDGKNIIAVGQVGVGTDSPTAKLTVIGDADIQQLRVEKNSVQTADVVQAGDVTGGNYFAIEADGTFRLQQDAAVTKDENFSATQLLPSGGGNQPDLVSLDSTNILIAAFPHNKVTYGSDHRELQHDYREGTDLRPHIHWMPVDATSGVVRWGLDYYIRSGVTVLASGTVYVNDTAPGTAWEEQRIEFPAISGSSLTIGDQISFRLFRDATDVADTYGAYAAVTTYGYHYEVDTLGSRTTFAK